MRMLKPVLRVVRGTAVAKTPTTEVSRTRTLRAVLDAQLAPGLTVEAASHANISYLDGDFPSLDKVRAERKSLRSAGLDLGLHQVGLPDAIVLSDPNRFVAHFPGLAFAVAVLQESNGVQPYTPGWPRTMGVASPL